MVVLEKDGATIGTEVEGVPSTTLNSGGREDSQSSYRLDSSLGKSRIGSISCNGPHSLISLGKCISWSFIFSIMAFGLAYKYIHLAGKKNDYHIYP